MSRQRVFGVLLTDKGWEDLEQPLKPYTSEGKIGKYIYYEEVRPDGSYFVIIVTSNGPDGTAFEAEISIPHHYIKSFIAAAERKQIGLISEQ